MSKWVAPNFYAQGFHAVCSNCGGLAFCTDHGGAQVVVDGHVCKPAKPPERVPCDCDLRVGGCKRKAAHR